MQNETFWDGHRDRLRLRAEEQGWEKLKDHEIVELVLYYAVPRQDMAELARALMNRFGSLATVFHASRQELAGVPGVTRTIADWLMMTGELMDAYLPYRYHDGKVLFRFMDVMRFLAPRWRAVRPPECWMIYTDQADCVITYGVLCDTLSWYHPEYMRHVVDEAVSLNARHAVMVMFVGVLPLETEDEDFPSLVSFCHLLSTIDVELLDVVLVGESGFYSMNEAGKFDAVRAEARRLDRVEEIEDTVVWRAMKDQSL